MTIPTPRESQSSPGARRIGARPCGSCRAFTARSPPGRTPLPPISRASRNSPTPAYPSSSSRSPTRRPIGTTGATRTRPNATGRKAAATASAMPSTCCRISTRETRPRADKAPGPETAALTQFVLRLAEQYPPRLVLDLHEDELSTEGGYIYSQGRQADGNPAGAEIIRLLQATGIPLRQSGKTRFGETIVQGVISRDDQGRTDPRRLDRRVARSDRGVRRRQESPRSFGPHRDRRRNACLRGLEVRLARRRAGRRRAACRGTVALD